MSLDITSHPGRPGLDELVPSRYALNVGAIDVMVISDGVLPLPGAMLGHNADPAVRAAWLEDKFLPPDGFDWALNAVVVRSGGRTILIDAGVPIGNQIRTYSWCKPPRCRVGTIRPTACTARDAGASLFSDRWVRASL